jgi:hypothetical protein
MIGVERETERVFMTLSIIAGNLQAGPQRANHRVTESIEDSGIARIDERYSTTQAVKRMALYLGFVFSVFSVTRW